MKLPFASMLLAGLMSFSASAATVVVPGTSNLWLAGMPAGATASGDTAPEQSPAGALSVVAGERYTFSVSGRVSNHPSMSGASGPDGGYMVTHVTENGMSGVSALINALVGVFLGADQPDAGAAPAELNFLSTSSRNFVTLSPHLQQTFYIGDGRTSWDSVQSFIAPAGATRLFLGTLDTGNWNNAGQFTVETNATVPTPAPVPVPAALPLMLLGAASLAAMRRRGA